MVQNVKIIVNLKTCI